MKDGVEYFKEEISDLLDYIYHEMEMIDMDARDEGGPMSPLLYGRLKTYKEIAGYLEGILEGSNE